jgi:hypothetical protein
MEKQYTRTYVLERATHKYGGMKYELLENKPSHLLFAVYLNDRYCHKIILSIDNGDEVTSIKTLWE